nr:hypothetical protein CFP56_14663 [Quercus suber]
MPNCAGKLVGKQEIAAHRSLFGWVGLNGFCKKGTETEPSTSGFGAQDSRPTTGAVGSGCSELGTGGLGKSASEMDNPTLAI